MRITTADVLVPEFYDMTDRVLVGIGRSYKNGSISVETDEGPEKLTKDDFKEKLGACFIGNGQYVIM